MTNTSPIQLFIRFEDVNGTFCCNNEPVTIFGQLLQDFFLMRVRIFKDSVQIDQGGQSLLAECSCHGNKISASPIVALFHPDQVRIHAVTKQLSEVYLHLPWL